MLRILNLAQKQKLAKKVEPFTLKEGIMYRVAQDNKLCRCLTTSKKQIVLKELHEGEWLEDILLQIFIAKKILDA
jgi:hypothetical protein